MGAHVTFGQRVCGYVLAGAIAAALLFWIFGRIDGWLTARDQEITRASQAQLALHPALVRWRAKIRALEQLHARDAARLAIAGDSLMRLAQAADSADSARAVAAGQPVPAPSPWRTVADSNRAAYEHCSVAYRSCERRAASAEAEADSLVRRLAAQLTVKPKRCWLAIGGGVAIGHGTAWGATLSASCGLVRIPLLP